MQTTTYEYALSIRVCRYKLGLWEQNWLSKLEIKKHVDVGPIALYISNRMHY